jgi:hypothetical protein
MLSVPSRTASAIAFTWVSESAEQITKKSVGACSLRRSIITTFAAFLDKAKSVIFLASVLEVKERSSDGLLHGPERAKIFADHDGYVKVSVSIDFLNHAIRGDAERLGDLMSSLGVPHTINDAREGDIRLLVVAQLYDIEPSRPKELGEALAKLGRSCSVQDVELNDVRLTSLNDSGLNRRLDECPVYE